MKTAAIVLSATAALVSLIQPCPAPVLPFAVAIGGAAVAGLSAATAADIINNNGGVSKRDGGLDNCLLDITINNINNSSSYIQVGASQELTMVYNVPASCMAELDSWNARPNIGALNSIYGEVKKVDGSTVSIYKAPAIATVGVGYMGISVWGQTAALPPTAS